MMYICAKFQDSTPRSIFLEFSNVLMTTMMQTSHNTSEVALANLEVIASDVIPFAFTGPL